MIGVTLSNVVESLKDLVREERLPQKVIEQLQLVRNVLHFPLSYLVREEDEEERV